MTAADDRHYDKMLDRMDRNRYYRDLGTAVYVAPELPRPKRVRASTGRKHDTIRPCVGCGRPTRQTGDTLADYPGTVPRVKDDTCRRCVSEQERGAPARRSSFTIDVEAAKVMYAAGESANAIGRVMGCSGSKVRIDLIGAGVTMRTDSAARRARMVERVAA